MNQQTETGEKKSRKKLLLIMALIVVLIVVAVVLVFVLKKGYRLIKVNSFQGDVKIERTKGNQASEMLDAFEGLRLVSEDVVTVNAGAFLELLADDDKHIGAEENTGFAIHATGSDKNGNITIELLYGQALFTIDNKLNEDSSFEVTTPNATLSVRGTKFMVAYDAEKGLTTVEVYEGTVNASYNNGEQTLEVDDKLMIDEQGEVSAGEILFVVNHTCRTIEDFVPDTIASIQVITEQYDEQDREGTYNATVAGTQEAGILDDKLYELERDYIEPHKDEIHQYFTDHQYEALDIIQNGGEVESVAVTDWFPDTITLEGENRTYVCHVTQVNMRLVRGDMPIPEDPSTIQQVMQGFYSEDGYFVYVGGVAFEIQGYIE